MGSDPPLSLYRDAGSEGQEGTSREQKRARADFFSREMMGGKMLPCLGYLSTSKLHRPGEAGLQGEPVAAHLHTKCVDD